MSDYWRIIKFCGLQLVRSMQLICRPVSRDKVQKLRDRWQRLPDSLRQPNQILGKHWVQCGYTLGPSYCSFGCSHCYLPKAANKVPLVPLIQMKQQIDAHRTIMGEGGNLQITGGDVVEAYFRAGRPNELVEVLRYATQSGLVPMLMTHGQVLLEQPEYFALLVNAGGLRKLSVHIDITMTGRPGYPVKSLNREGQLNPLRDQLVNLVMGIRQQTGHHIVAAQTVTVVQKNLQSLQDIIQWITARTENLDVCRTISFQTEAEIGRTKISPNPITSEQVWSELENALGKKLPRDHLLFGHPQCSSSATLLIRPRDRCIVNLESQSPAGRMFWSSLLTTFGGLGASTTSPMLSMAQKLGALIRRPVVIIRSLVYLWHMLKNGDLTGAFIWAGMRGQVRGVNLVMHNFMNQSDLQHPLGETAIQRLEACVFKGVVRRNGEWEAVSMCEMNANIRPEIYRQEISTSQIA